VYKQKDTCQKFSGLQWDPLFVGLFVGRCRTCFNLGLTVLLQSGRGLALIGAMSRDGLLLAFSTTGADREPSAVAFTALAATLGAAILNQPNLMQLVSVTAIVSHALTAACSLETQYRPYSSDDTLGRRRRRNRKRKLNYESRTRTGPTTPGMGTYNNDLMANCTSTSLQQSNTVTTTADVHATGTSNPTPKVTSSHKPDAIDVTESSQHATSMYVRTAVFNVSLWTSE